MTITKPMLWLKLCPSRPTLCARPRLKSQHASVVVHSTLVQLSTHVRDFAAKIVNGALSQNIIRQPVRHTTSSITTNASLPHATTVPKASAAFRSSPADAPSKAMRLKVCVLSFAKLKKQPASAHAPHSDFSTATIFSCFGMQVCGDITVILRLRPLIS